MAKILVVDDEPNIQEVVGLYLRREGYDVLSAADGEEGLELYRQGRPDLVVLDLILPKLDGLEVCRRIQAGRRVPLIMLTARGEEADRVLGMGAGADDYVVKPFRPRELMARLGAAPGDRGPGRRGGRWDARVRRAAPGPGHARGGDPRNESDAHGAGVRPPLPPGVEPRAGVHE